MKAVALWISMLVSRVVVWYHRRSCFASVQLVLSEWILEENSCFQICLASFKSPNGGLPPTRQYSTKAEGQIIKWCKNWCRATDISAFTHLGIWPKKICLPSLCFPSSCTGIGEFHCNFSFRCLLFSSPLGFVWDLNTMTRAPSTTSLCIHPLLQPCMFSVSSKKNLFLCL